MLLMSAQVERALLMYRTGAYQYSGEFSEDNSRATLRGWLAAVDDKVAKPHRQQSLYARAQQFVKVKRGSRAILGDPLHGVRGGVMDRSSPAASESD